MHYKFYLTLFLILSHFIFVGQDLDRINKANYEIDSLIKYNLFDQVERKVDSLLLVVNHTKQEELKLKLLLQKASALDSKAEYAKSLPVYLDVLSIAEKKGYVKIEIKANICISLIHEINKNYDLAYIYLKKAFEKTKKYGFEDMYSTLLVRLSSIHRMMVRNKSSIDAGIIHRLEKIGFVANLDSTLSFAQQAIPFAIKFDNQKDLHDTYFLIGAYYSYHNQHKTAIDYYLKDIATLKKMGSYEDIFLQFVNISKLYLKINEPSIALRYSDSAYTYFSKVPVTVRNSFAQQRAAILHALHQADSAYHFLTMALQLMEESNIYQSQLDLKKLEEEYQNNKKEETIKNKNRLVLLISSLLLLIVLASVLVISKNKKISQQNKIINNQLQDLKKGLEQKQVLLSELQHRVKNNLQYVISILELQKESASHSNIEELIKSNQNRIHSIALLHKKLDVNEKVNDVELDRYVEELSDLVKHSYDHQNKNVNLYVSCQIMTLPIAKAMPIGLIIVELISNSMKHAFSKIKNGIINIEITNDEKTNMNKLHYIDNGPGFDLYATSSKGLGVEIMKGLVDQLNGRIETCKNKGFELIIYFS